MRVGLERRKRSSSSFAHPRNALARGGGAHFQGAARRPGRTCARVKRKRQPLSVFRCTRPQGRRTWRRRARPSALVTRLRALAALVSPPGFRDRFRGVAQSRQTVPITCGSGKVIQISSISSAPKYEANSEKSPRRKATFLRPWPSAFRIPE